jgi:hypothetical protein
MIPCSVSHSYASDRTLHPPLVCLKLHALSPAIWTEDWAQTEREASAGYFARDAVSPPRQLTALFGASQPPSREGGLPAVSPRATAHAARQA